MDLIEPMAPKKVLQFVDGSPFGGVEQSALSLLAGLDRRHWQPVLLHYSWPDAALLLQRAKDLDTGVRGVRRARVHDPLSTVAEVPAFLRALRRERPAVLHVHVNWPLSSLAGLIAGHLAGVPAVVATVHLFPAVSLMPPDGSIPTLPGCPRFEWGLQRWASSYANCFVAVSSEIAERLHQDFRVPRDKIHIVPNGISPSHFDVPPDAALRAILNGGTHRAVVLTTARLAREKGHRYLLEAAARVPDAMFVLVGDGPERTALESQARQLGLSERVTFLGFRRDVPSLLACSDLVVLPSLFEGLSVSLLEAMAAGRAVIASAIAGVTEVVVHGETGLVVPPKDSSALAAAIRTLLADPTLATRLGAAGKTRAAKLFSATAMSESVMQIYERALRARNGASSRPGSYAGR
ncbi:MAG TPA: glycosyltransferase family 4 protein [bacterium]|nr:glycosyltransferase family 4 protein [bacterium]